MSLRERIVNDFMTQCETNVKMITISDFLLLFFMLSSIIPIINERISNIPTAMVMMAWLIVNASGKFGHANKWDAISLLFIAYCLIACLITGNQMIIKTYVYGFLELCFPILVYDTLKKNKYKQSMMYRIICLSLAILVLSFYLKHELYPDRSQNGYYMAYTSVFIAIIACYYSLRELHWKKIIALSIMAIVIVAITMCHFMIAIIATVLGLYIMFRYSKRWSRISCVFLVCIVTILFILSFSGNRIIYLIGKEVNNHDLITRIEEIKSLIIEGKVGLNMEERIRVYLTSIKTIIQHPIGGGIVTITKGNFYNYVGYHSTILDSLAIFGVVPGGLLLYIMISPFYSLLKRSGAHEKALVVATATCFFVIVILNNQISAIAIMAYCAVPYIVDKKNMEHNSDEYNERRGI